jgi:hypothetical protein
MRSFVALGLALAAAAPAAAQATNTNAAMKYWQAIGLLPTLDKEQERYVEEWNKVPLDAGARKVIDQSRNSVEYLRRGARLDRCDWAVDYEDGVGLLLPHLAKARTLARLTALSARAEFEQGNGKAGWADALAVLRLARHIQVDRIMISQVVGYGLEGLGIDAAAPHLPGLKGLAADMAADLNRLPPARSPTEVLRQEKDSFLGWMIRELRQAERAKPGSWQEVWKALYAGEKDPATRAAAESVKSADQAVKGLEELLPVYDELAKLMALPWKEFEARHPEFVRKAKAANPLAAAVLPAVDRVLANQRRAEARLAMFKAAVAIVRDGPDQVKGTKDPFGDGPFGYRAVGDGFELTSKLTYQGKPVTLTVGKRAD